MIFFLYQNLNEQLAFDLKCKSEHPIFYRILSVYLIYDLPKKEKYEDAKGPVRCRKLKRTDNTMANRGMTKDKQGSGNTNSTNNMV
jgi:hypothetical protein